MKPMVDCSAGGWWPPGCGLVSQANDGFAGSVSSYVAGVLESMASWMWSFISGSFSVSDIDPSEWSVVSGVTNWWIVVMMTPLVVVMIIQLVSGLISQQGRRIGRAMLGGALAIPLVFLATSLMSKVSSFTDSASTALLNTLGKDPYLVFMRLFGFQRAPAGSGREWDIVSFSIGADAGAASGVIVTAIAVLIVWILAFILMCSMIFRSFALIVLAAVAPVALMLLPWERTKSWARLWCETVVALLIAKPLAATVLAVAVKLFGDSTSFSGLASGAVGMMLACAAPLMALKLVSFASGEIAGAAQMAGGGHVMSRAGSFTGRQLGRQFGGKFHLPAMSKGAPRPIPSTSQQNNLHMKAAAVPTRIQGPTTTAAIASDGRPAHASSQGPADETSRSTLTGSSNRVSGQPEPQPTHGPAPQMQLPDNQPQVQPAPQNQPHTQPQPQSRPSRTTPISGQATVAPPLTPQQPLPSKGENPHE